MSRIERLQREDPRWIDAVRLAVGGESQPAEQIDRAAAGLLESVEIQGLTLEPVFAAARGGQISGSCIAITTPGRSALAVLGPPNDDRVSVDAGVRLLEALRSALRGSPLTLLQALLPPGSTRTGSIFRNAGFEYLTELVYLDRLVSDSKPRVRPPDDLSYLTYTSDLESQFLSVLEGTYSESLDCPGLTGIRTTRDILVGHSHTGLSSPGELWFLGMCGGRPSGVLLLSGVHRRSCLEVVYMGVVPEARGVGLGDALLSLAVDVGRRRGDQYLTLAVDATNTYACRAYRRWGFCEVARRRAWICRSPF